MPILNKVDFLSNPSHEKNARRFLENDPWILDFLSEGGGLFREKYTE